MNSKVLLICAGLLVCLAGTTPKISSADEPNDLSVGELRKELQELRRDLASVKERLARLETNQAPSLSPQLPSKGGLPFRVIPPNEQLFPRPKETVPPSWRPFPFQGQTYYIVPLQTGGEQR